MDSTEDINNLKQWIATMDNRLTVIETIINDEGTRQNIETVETLKRSIDGDPDLNVPPLYQTISEIREYQDDIGKYHANLKYNLSMLALTNVITFILVIISLLT